MSDVVATPVVAPASPRPVSGSRPHGGRGLLSWLSLVWLGIEGTVAVVAGVMAGSVA